jgi:hypothetical protein
MSACFVNNNTLIFPDMLTQDYLSVPIELVQYAHQNKMNKALGLYLALKASCDGHTLLTPEHKGNLMAILGIKDRRSFNCYLKQLKSNNWVGHDLKTGIYYIRGNNSLRRRYRFRKSSAVVFYIGKDAKNISAFVQGAILNHELMRRVRGRNIKIRKLAGSSALLKESAIHELAAKGQISEYIGLSLSSISKLLGVKQSQADRIKKNLVVLGYIKLKAHYKTISVSDVPDFTILKYMPTNRRYSVKKIKAGYEFRERTFDEIFACMDFKNQKAMVRRAIW